ncbi:MAG: L-lactate permease [Candidatus Thorarchaeota archaeon]|nr:L-lactate permease [Candidatus Thorarchaeota archaeon]
MDPLLGLLLIIAPIILALIMLIVLHKAADTTGVVVWFATVAIAVVAFQTDVGVALTASVVGIVRSFPISLMVLTSILMMTYMQETGALSRLIVFFKTLGGGSRPMQIMLISLGLGLFLVGIGATPVSMLPPVMLALGFSPLVAVALPSIGYDPLTTFALLGVPAQVFTDVYSSVSGTAIDLWFAGSIFAAFMPVVSVGIAVSMLWIAGGKKLLMNREGLFLAILAGGTAGFTAIICNLEIVNLTRLTNVIAGAAVLGVLFVYNKTRKKPFLDREQLAEEDHEIEKGMSLLRASIPWIILVALSLLTTLVDPIKQLLAVQMDLAINFGQYQTAELVIRDYVISTKFLWQAYTLMLIATLVSMPFFKNDKTVLKNTFNKFIKRAPRPVLAAAIFFAMAEVLNFSGFIPDVGGIWIFPADPTNNMVYLLASLTSTSLGTAYPLTAAFLGLLAGFISGSETSAIAMFTNYHYQASTAIGANAVVVAASSGIGGGLASVLSPAKIQNAAAVIDQIGIEGQVIRYGAVVAILMTTMVAIMTMLWAFA